MGELRAKFRNRKWHGWELRAPAKAKERETIIDEAFEDLGLAPKALHCICLIGLKSWLQLDAKDQEYWMMSGGRLKGVDCRDAVEQCESLTQYALADLLIQRTIELKPPKSITSRSKKLMGSP